jgi:cystathionine gamma-lyase
MKFETRAIHVGEEPNVGEGGTGDVVTPIHLASTFARREVEQPTAGYEYSRTDNPTRTVLQQKLASLENAKYALGFSSGLGAETTVLLSLVKSGDHIVAFDDLYGGTRRLFNRIFSERFDVECTFVDARDPAHVDDAVQSNTALIWLETPTNPLLKLCDIETITLAARNRGIRVVVDNTFASPYFQQPLRLGADISLHSTTKYLNGHCDSVGGAVILSDDGLYDELKFAQNAAGAILSPFDSYLISRGVKTLAVRMKQHEENALAIAQFLESHRRVNKVYYPGLPSHPQHALARKQMSGSGGVLSFELDGGVQDAKAFVERLELFLIAESLGGVESLIELPALMTHASVPPGERRKIGLADGLIRISAGIEAGDDLIADLDQALSKTVS